jgi:hypothetical protein
MSNVYGACRAAAIAAVVIFAAGLACDWVQDAAGLTLELERRYPGSEIEIQELHDGGVTTVQAKIIAPSFGEGRDLAGEARDVAATIRDRYGLGDSDIVAIEFRQEMRAGALGSSHAESYSFPVADL